MNNGSSKEEDFIKQLIEIVEANLNNEQFGVSELAREIGMSRSNLHRKVKASANSSVSQFIRKVRLKKALEMLKQSGLTVSEVTWKVGFGSTSYFIKCFHEHYGFPPGEVGKKNKVANESINKNAGKPFVRIRLMYVWIAIVAITIGVFALFNQEKFLGLFTEKKTYIVEYVIFSIEIENHTNDPIKIIDERCLEILLQDAVLRMKGKLLLKEKEFEFMHPAKKRSIKIPEKEVLISFINRDINYELIAKIKNNVTGQSLNYNFTINEATDLLKVVILNLANSIVDNSSQIEPLVDNWDAFMSYCEGIDYWSVLDINKARNAFNKAIAGESAFVLPKLKLAEISHFQRNNQLAAYLLNEIDLDNSLINVVDSLKFRALENKLKGNYNEIIENYKALKSIMPANKEVYYEMAEAYFGMRDITRAISNYKQALNIDNQYALAMNHLAFCYSHTGQHNLALNWSKKYVELDSSANSYDSYAKGFLSAGKYDSAQYFSLEGLKIDPNVEYLHRNLCFINLELGKIEQAEESVNNYINSLNDPALICNGLTAKSLIYFKQGKYQMAIDTCLKAKFIYDEIDLLSRNHELHYLLAKSYYMVGETEKANAEMSEMKFIINRFKITEFKYNEIFKFYKALEFLIACKELNTENIQEITNLFDLQIADKIKDWTSFFDKAFFNTQFGIELLDQNLYVEAEERFNNALEYNPNYSTAIYYLFRLNLLLENNEKALSYKKDFLTKMKDADEEYLNQFELN